MKQIRTLIVDDESIAREILRQLLENDSEIDVVDECSSGGEAIVSIKKHKPDLVFLDIQMPEQDGFEVLEKIPPKSMPFVVFVTAYDQYAIRAFEVNAVDYLLKPFNDTRFQATLARAKEQIRQCNVNDVARKLMSLVQERPIDLDTGPEQHSKLRRLLIKSEGRIILLQADDVDWIQGADYCVRIHAGKEAHLVRDTMGSLEKKLDPDKFCRIHRSTIVNVDRIKEMSPLFKGDYVVILQDGTRLRLSRNRREQLESILGRGSSRQ